MTAKIGWAEGKCSKCGRTLRRRRPADYAVCDCYKYCPMDHGKGSYMTSMDPYTPDLTPPTYGPIEGEDVTGDTDAPLRVLYKCPKCGYYSAQKPVEVRLT
jgi:ssDNA-binding Zn-finger/Zn-ribbon topoisomerase 1